MPAVPGPELAGHFRLPAPGSPFQLGSYSYWKVGQYMQLSGIEAAAADRVHFAGERAADDVLDAL